ncbi:MAG: hypothetical protein CSA11_11280 [Chloroflexi bacterium]|nr:MAG: hypothetical protein CSB13_03090 [Chloroflexota bacterium]PIE79689.1 MAG: hypothetical protein CSA11_11280 [Chloroflexota bacterium]
MFSDLDESIKNMLTAEIPIKNGQIDIKFDQPVREWSTKLVKPTVNFYLYDVRENVVLRQHQWEQLRQNDGAHFHVTHMKRTPFRVDCHYMLTTWAAEADDEHLLLARCLLALFRNPIIAPKYLVGEMQEQPFEIQAKVASNDKLTNPAEVWSALDNEMRPSISYVVTVAMDPWNKVTGPAVRTLTLRSGISENPPSETLAPETAVHPKSYIGGIVSKKGSPQANINIAIKGTGYFTTTDDNGRFRLGSLLHGDYTLVAWPEKGKPKETKVTIPGKDYDIQL